MPTLSTWTQWTLWTSVPSFVFAAGLPLAMSVAGCHAAPAVEPMFPSPYSADAIRDATHVGRTYTWKVEDAGKPPSRRTVRFLAVTGEGATIESSQVSESGTTSAAKTALVTWDELRSHGEFPRDSVKAHDETVTVPAGTFPCVVYVVSRPDGTVTSFAFATLMPGAPVRFVTEKNGVPVSTTTLVEYAAGK